MELGRCKEALESHERAIALQPGYAEAWSDRGNTLARLKHHEPALESYGQAIALRPDYATAHLNRALCTLLLGDYASGWGEYEWRWQDERREKYRRDFAQPLWLGAQHLQGKTILLHSDQGLGDTLHFCRYAQLVAASGAKVILEVQPELLPLLAGLQGVAPALAKGSALPPFDFHCPLLARADCLYAGAIRNAAD